MHTYKQLYEGVLRKLDKFGSPDFDIPDFNMFMNQAIRNVLTPALDYAETNQKTTDNIRMLMAKVVYSKSPQYPVWRRSSPQTAACFLQIIITSGSGRFASRLDY